ncbi:hypothetical protein QTP86_031801 [Hemibagrus guttatus]|nr:hypothetical protein QTP86_031801 [Hemibagrus guttatus]
MAVVVNPGLDRSGNFLVSSGNRSRYQGGGLGFKMGILTVLEDDDAPASQSTVINTAIVLEEVIVLTDLPDIPIAFAELFGLLFALNMESKNNTT